MIDNINWYPGHMKKTRELIQENLKMVDAVIEVIDARIPISSRNPIIDELVKSKPRIIVLNKSDLADDKAVKDWAETFRRQGNKALAMNCMSGAGSKELFRLLSSMEAEKNKDKVRQKPYRLMIVGVPNVGKSSLINRMTGKKSAQTGDRPGVTRGKQWLRLQNGMQLLDTPGILWPKFEDPKAGLNLAFCGSIKDEILDVPTLAMELIGVLAEHYPQLLMDRYKLEETGETPLETMEMMAQKRGCILPGKRIDYERIGKLTLDEFRGGKIGRITLELPPVPAKSSAGGNGDPADHSLAGATCSADDFAVADSHSPAETPTKGGTGMTREERLEKQKQRLIEMKVPEEDLHEQGYRCIAGIDEVGRGPLAGPVVAAAVVLPEEFSVLGIDDSKKLSEKRREELFVEIKKHAVAWGIGMADHQVIDEINILQATKLAMRRAVHDLEQKLADAGKDPLDYLLFDAVKIEELDLPQQSIIKGDAKVLAIAAASIIAKVTRDRMMVKYAEVYPGYAFEKNKGYGTKAHYEGLGLQGICPIHRRTFLKGKSYPSQE